MKSFANVLDGASLTALSQRLDPPAAIRAFVQVTLLAGSGYLLVVAADPFARVAAFVLQAAMQFAMFGMLHETVHGTAFRARAANVAASWLAAIWQFASPAWMRAFHFTHHRHTHELAHDPELAGMASMLRWPRGPLWLATVTGLPLLAARIVFTLVGALGLPSLSARLMPYVAPADRGAVARDARLLVLVHAGIVSAACTWRPELFWLYGAAVAAHAALSIYLACEHRGLPEGGSIFDRTRSLRAGPLLRFLLWNMPYHAEHHAYPSVPFHALPTLHAELRPHLRHSGHGVLALYRRGWRQP